MQDSILNPRYLWIVYITAISVNAERSQMYCTDAKKNKTKRNKTKQHIALPCHHTLHTTPQPLENSGAPTASPLFTIEGKPSVLWASS